MKQSGLLVLVASLVAGCATDGPLGTVAAIVTAPIRVLPRRTPGLQRVGALSFVVSNPSGAVRYRIAPVNSRRCKDNIHAGDWRVRHVSGRAAHCDVVEAAVAPPRHGTFLEEPAHSLRTALGRI